MPRRSYFTVGEVERLIPALEGIFARVVQLRSALRVQERRLETAGIGVSREMLERDDSRDPIEVRQAKGLFRGFYEALSDALVEVKNLGGEVKDMELGLVDFPGQRGRDEILLCWRLGEKAIEFWHTADDGYAGRRPIDDQVPRDPTRLD